MLKRSAFFGLALLVIVLDQLSKAWIVRSVQEISEIQLIPQFLYITHTTNTGGAFGVFQHSPLLLAFTAIVVIIGIGIYVARTEWPLPLLLGVGLALPLGGALGNFIDRVRLGYVVDFIEIRLGSYTWPIFNLADSAICIGVGLLVYTSLTMPSPQNAEEIKPLT